jgi:hypothetical protein
MAKKQTAQEVEERDAIQNEGTDEPAEAGAFAFDSDFNAEEEYKIPPLVPQGKYEGTVSAVRFDASNYSLVWEVTMRADSDVLMSDNETPVNGNVMLYKNWFPKAGDEDIRTKTGKMSKRQSKINMLADFQKAMRINMNTPEAIINGVNNAEWIGIDVLVDVEIREYEGRLSNQLKSMIAM